MRRIVLALTLLLSLFSLEQGGAQRRKVGLVLGGGGAKGAAEVGVLKVMEEAGIPIDYIVGTSIGSIVGGLYAIGYDAKELDSLFRTQDWIFLLSDQVNRKDLSPFSKEERSRYLLRVPLSAKQTSNMTAGLMTGQNLYNLFSKMTIGYHNVSSFAQLPIPFACIAVDVVTGKEVVMDRGSLPMAMRSSMSIPGVFAPVAYGDSVLIDGGALNNFPTDVARRMGADIIIGVDLSTGWKTKEEINSMGNVVSQLINIMGEQKYLQNKRLADLYINPGLKGYGPASFQKNAIDSMITKGEKAARAKWGELMALKKEIYTRTDDTLTVEKKSFKGIQQTFLINQIRMDGVSESEARWLRKRIKLRDKDTVSIGDIGHALSLLQGLDIFSSVEYRLTDSNPSDLVFTLKEKEYKSINVGFRFDTEDVASILANVSNEKKLESNHHYNLTGRLSKNPYLEISYHYGNYFNPKFGLSYYLGYNDFRFYSHNRKIDNTTYIRQSLSGQFIRTLSDFRLLAGLRYDYFSNDEQFYNQRYEPVSNKRKHLFNYFANLSLDTYNDTYYPTRGGKVELEGTLHTDNGATYCGHSPFLAVAGNAQTALRLSSRLFLLPQIKGRCLFGTDIASAYQNYVGGIYDGRHLMQQIAWESTVFTHLLRKSFIATRLAVRYRVEDNIYFSAVGEYGKDDNRFLSLLKGRDLWGCTLRASYNSILGPIGIQVSYSSLYKNINTFINAGMFF